MSGFFSLGSGAVTNPTQQDPSESSTSWLLYGTATTTRTSHHHHHCPTATKDFELWQHHLPHAHNLLAAGPANSNSNSMGGGTGGRGTDDGRFINFADESTWRSAGFVMMSGGGGSGSGGGGMSCQDCGNQAKKDCPHIRCRTCCKSRGFQCPTHVKSTWVPAAKRRERQQHHSGGQEEDDNRRHLVQNNIKRTRSVQDPGNPNLVNPNSAATAVATGFDHAGNFPQELATPADFRCVRVSSIDETEDQIAYQAAVNIGGHLFKGILYDQGPEDHYMGGDTSSGGSGGNLQLNRTAISPGGSTAAAANFSGHSLYSSLGGNDYVMTSTQFFHQISRD